MKRLLTTFLSLALLFACAMAQQALKPFDITLHSDSAKAEPATVRVFLPDPSTATGRAVVACPGGGYSHLALDHEGYDWAPFFNKQGIALIVLKYRLPHGDRSLPINDGIAAMRLVRTKAAEWHINPHDVGIMGSSAGGHLASTIATHTDFADRPDFQILFYPVISMNIRETHKGSVVNFLGKGQTDERQVNEYSNFRKVRRHLTPPTIMLLSHDDDAVPPVTNAIAYYSALRRVFVPTAMHIYPSGGHGWGFKSTFEYHDEMLRDLTDWLRHLPSVKTNAIRVACVGNSITDGSGIDMSETKGYPAKLQNLLGNNYWVKNFGVSGRTMLSKGDYPYINEQAYKDCQQFKPNIIVIKLGTNDSKPKNWKYKDEYVKDMRNMIGVFKALDSKPKIYLCYPIKAFSNKYTISDTVIHDEVIPMIKKVAKKEKLSVIDLYTPFEHYKEGVQSDGIHPNEKGAQKMADVVYGAITKE